MDRHDLDRTISMHCPICGYKTSEVDLPLPTLDRALLRAALAKTRSAPEWDAGLEPHCPRCHRSRLLLDIGSLDRQPEHAPV
jgi:hypothetical protein